MSVVSSQCFRMAVIIVFKTKGQLKRGKKKPQCVNFHRFVFTMYSNNTLHLCSTCHLAIKMSIMHMLNGISPLLRDT